MLVAQIILTEAVTILSNSFGLLNITHTKYAANLAAQNAKMGDLITVNKISRKPTGVQVMAQITPVSRITEEESDYLLV